MVVSGGGEALAVDFCGEVHDISPSLGVPWGFGRNADLDVDDNRFLHRRLGEFVWRDGWWLLNVGRTIAIEIHDAVTLSHVVLAPSASIALPFAVNVLRFVAGGTNYELVVRQAVPGIAMADDIMIDDGHTATIGHIPLTPSQRQLIVSLAEHRLLDPAARDAAMPTNREAANRLGWELTKFNRKLDNVCDKLRRQGVRGLHGTVDTLATDRRRRLVDFAVTTALVTAADLSSLDDAAPADSSA
jgi:hypothetical protein